MNLLLPIVVFLSLALSVSLKADETGVKTTTSAPSAVRCSQIADPKAISVWVFDTMDLQQLSDSAQALTAQIEEILENDASNPAYQVGRHLSEVFHALDDATEAYVTFLSSDDAMALQKQTSLLNIGSQTMQSNLDVMKKTLSSKGSWTRLLKSEAKNAKKIDTLSKQLSDCLGKSNVCSIRIHDLIQDEIKIQKEIRSLGLAFTYANTILGQTLQNLETSISDKRVLEEVLSSIRHKQEGFGVTALLINSAYDKVTGSIRSANEILRQVDFQKTSLLPALVMAGAPSSILTPTGERPASDGRKNLDTSGVDPKVLEIFTSTLLGTDAKWKQFKIFADKWPTVDLPTLMHILDRLLEAPAEVRAYQETSSTWDEAMASFGLKRVDPAPQTLVLALRVMYYCRKLTSDTWALEKILLQLKAIMQVSATKADQEVLGTFLEMYVSNHVRKP